MNSNQFKDREMTERNDLITKMNEDPQLLKQIKEKQKEGNVIDSNKAYLEKHNKLQDVKQQLIKLNDAMVELQH